MLYLPKTSKLKHKLILIYFILMISIIFSVVIVIYKNSTDIIRNQSIALNDKLVDMGAISLDASIDQIDKVFQALYINSDFKKYLSVPANMKDADFLSTYNGLKSVMLSLINYRRDIFSIIYIDKRNFMAYTTRKEAGFDRNFTRDEIPEEFKKVLDISFGTYQEKILIPTYVHIPIPFKVTNTKQKVFTVARKIINVDGHYEYMGAMFINVDMSTLEKITLDIKPFKDAYTYIISKNGTIVYDSNKEKTGEMLDNPTLDKFNSERGNKQLSFNGKDYVAVYSTCESTGWKVVNFIPLNQYTANILLITKIILAITLAAVLVSVLVILITSKYITDPIEKLSTLMSRIELGNMDLRADESGSNEISTLGRNFNILLEKLKCSIKNEYESNIRKKDAEMKALQAQINPHFLYNVLQSISSIAVIHKIDDVDIIARSLGKMLRYSIKTKENIVSVNEECEHIRNYLSIQKIRFQESLTYDIDIPQYMRQKSMLKLTLQPLVENAIIHGFEYKDHNDIIYIKGEIIGDYLLFEISDNGVGISTEKLEKIKNDLVNMDNAFYTDEYPSIGLKNVLARLRLFYNDDANINIESEQDVGTTVTVKIPLEIVGAIKS